MEPKLECGEYLVSDTDNCLWMELYPDDLPTLSGDGNIGAESERFSAIINSSQKNNLSFFQRMETESWSQLIKQLNDKDANKIVIFMQLKSCVTQGNLPSMNEIIDSFPKLTAIINDENENLFVRHQSAYLITDIGNDYELNLTFKIPMDAIKSLISLLSSDETHMLDLHGPIIKLLAILCNCDEIDQKQLFRIVEYRKCILYETKAAEYVYNIITNLISNNKFYSCSLSINAMKSFIPRGSVLVNENNWYQVYGQYVLNGFCQCIKIKDAFILGDVCDGLSTLYVLSTHNHRAGAICVEMLKKLYNSREYYCVKKAAKQAIMAIVIESYIRQAGYHNQYPSELVFQLAKFAGVVQ